MDSEDEFWIRVWRLVAWLLVSVVIVISSVFVHRDYQIARGLEQGIDAAKLSCAYATTTQALIGCAIYASKGRE